MCGIAGMIWNDPQRVGDAEPLEEALAAIWRRGPDGQGTLRAPGITAGMRRLAIIDLEGGQQPIFNETGDVGVLFNGEIYNFRELRKQCEARGHVFRTRSDTEVLVHLYEDHGPDFVSVLNGMFAFVIWDAPARRAVLARDRFGIKPLHIARTPDGLAFASEVKALAAAKWVAREINRDTLSAYMRFGWVPDQLSMWQGVTRLGPGQTLVVERGIARVPVRYHRHRIGFSPRKPDVEVDRVLDRLIDDAVEHQLVADVPVGLFLSGGIDSSLLAHAAHRRAHRLPCHTVAFREQDRRDLGDPDVEYARLLAERLGLDLHVHTVEPDTASLLPAMMRALDEPAADPAILNAYLIAKAASSTSKVLLTGMGADEIAGGYRRHLAAHMMRPFYGVPAELRRGLVGLARQGVGLLPSDSLATRPVLRRIRKALANVPVDPTMMGEAFALWLEPEFLQGLGLGDGPDMQALVHDAVDVADAGDPLNACLAFDVAAYLPSHNLFYTDKATMAASVEVRVPFLDNDLAEYVMDLSHRHKLRNWSTKLVFRRAAERHLPAEIAKRTKTGFGVPIRSWLRDSLRPMVMDLLSPAAVRRRGLFRPEGVAKILELFESNALDLAYPIWALLSLEVWCQETMDRPG
jgi:asparagine synthase (glutamine-hydrolysing)